MILVYLAVGIVFGMMSIVYSVGEGYGFFLALGLYSASGLVGMLAAVFLTYVWGVLVAFRPEAGADPVGPRFRSVRAGLLAWERRAQNHWQSFGKRTVPPSGPGTEHSRGQASRISGRRVRFGTGSTVIRRRVPTVSKRTARRVRWSRPT